MTAKRDPEFAAMLNRQIAEDGSRLSAIVVAGQAQGYIDPDLSIEAIVTLCQAIGLGFVLRRVVDRPLPAPDEWNTLMERLIPSLGPLRIRIHFVPNQNAVDPACYLKFAAVLERE